jgi:hypothetical protein
MQHLLSLPATTECTCSHVSIRDENHGDEKVLAVDLQFWLEGPNDLLDLFHPELRRGLYCNKAADSGQVEVDEAIAVLPNLRTPGLPEKLRFGGDDKHAGYRLIADYGLGDEKANIDLTECSVGKKWIEAKEGGTVRIGWRVSYAGEALNDVMTRGKLTGLMGQKAFIQLHAPATLQLVKGGKGSKPGKAGKGQQQEQGEHEPDAGDIFAQQHGGEQQDAAAGA